MKNITSLISGLIFSFGLIISGMVNPDKVIGFLDLFGKWDYSLAFVMGGAVLFNLISFTRLKKKTKSKCGDDIHWPTRKDIDAKLIIGSIMFGVGWGIVGICPGPGLVNLSLLEPKIITFVGSMIVGMFIFKLFSKRGAL